MLADTVRLNSDLPLKLEDIINRALEEHCACAIVPIQLEMEKRSLVRIREGTHEEATDALHVGRVSCHPKEAFAGAGADL
jgi:hypothetical protein